MFLFKLDFDPSVYGMFPRVSEIPFDSDRKLMTTVHEENGKYVVYTKGETQKSGNKVLYIAKLTVGEKGYELENITDEEEWMNAKKLMSEIVSQ